MLKFKNHTLALLIVFLLLIIISCNKGGVPSSIYGTWKLILQGSDNATHRIDTFSLQRTNDSVLQQYLTFNPDNLSGTLHIVGFGKDTGRSKWMDSTYNFTWLYFSDGPELWIKLIDNPKNRFNVWTDSNNIHLRVNYYNNQYFCDYFYEVLNSNVSHQQVFERYTQ